MSTDPRRTVETPTVNDSPFPTSSDDPTATKTLRNRHGAAMYRRFRALKSAIVTGVIERDAFGIAELSPEERAGPRTPATFADDYAANPLGPPEDPERFADFEECVEAIQGDGTSEAEARRICGAWEQAKNTTLEAAQDRQGGAGAGINIEPPRAGAFAFPSDDRKVGAFMEWLATQVDRGILEADPTATGRTVAGAEPWQNTYLRQAYAKGVTHADAFLVDQGIIPNNQTLDDVFRPVKHADAAGLIFTRAYNELEGVTDAMAQDMSRVLAEGLTQGHNPRKIARALNDRVEKVGLHRGRLIARTETIRSHNEGSLNRYEDVGNRIEGVTLLAEHITAGDNRVCPECEALAGTVYSIREARGRIPVHPNCRCTWVPVDARDAPPGQGGSQTAEERVTEFFDATSDLPPDEQVERVSEWLSDNTRLGTDPGRRAVRLQGFDPDRAHGVANAIMKMEHANVLERIPNGSVSVTTAAEVRNSPGLSKAIAWAKRERVTFNADRFTEDNLARLRDEGWLTGRFARRPIPPLEHGVIHEFGHVLHYQNLYERPRTAQAALSGRFSMAQRADIGGKISRYAATNPMEFVAESFVRIAYDLPMSPQNLALYQRYAGPDADQYRGFMLTEAEAANMDDHVTDAPDTAANTEETAFGDVDEDLPPELRAEAEVVFEAFADGLAPILPDEDL